MRVATDGDRYGGGVGVFGDVREAFAQGRGQVGKAAGVQRSWSSSPSMVSCAGLARTRQDCATSCRTVSLVRSCAR